jgi:hypothetical protein
LRRETFRVKESGHRIWKGRGPARLGFLRPDSFTAEEVVEEEVVVEKECSRVVVGVVV